MSSSAIERLRERVEQRDAQDAETWSHVPAMFSLARSARLRRSPPTMARPRCSELPMLTARRRWSSPSSLPSGNSTSLAGRSQETLSVGSTSASAPASLCVSTSITESIPSPICD